MRSTPELQQRLRDASTLPLEKLLNTGEVSVDFDAGVIHRDTFWKGSFASDTVLGWEERLRNKLFGSGRARDSIFTGGSFWKRFERVKDGVVHGHVVNYDVQVLPGIPEVRAERYPNARRRYFRKGDEVLLLTYTNEPYRIVYDVMKIVDENTVIGVMHLGTFPSGVEFATFVMERNNYPFEKMPAADHDMLFDRMRVPEAGELEGEWQAYTLVASDPATTLANQASTPFAFDVRSIARKNLRTATGDILLAVIDEKRLVLTRAGT